MPTPYRKSCQQCVKAKRRCDLGSPCYRCRVRRLSCSYSTASHGIRAIKGASSNGVTDGSTPGQPSDVRQLDIVTPPDMLESHLLPEFPDYNLDWNEIMTGIDDYILPDQMVASFPHPPEEDLTSRKYQERVVHSVKQMKEWPLSFASQAHAPFINLNIWPNELPDVIMEALGICSQYANRNNRNEQIVFQCLSQAAKDCVKRLSTPAEILPLSTRLAIAQAMCLYQTIQLFDGDIKMRGAAEKALPLLIQYLRDLRPSCKAVEYETALISNESEAAGGLDDWQDWLLQESLRRTLIAGFSIDGLFTYLKQGWDDDSEFLTLSFTAQKALWAAPSLYHWQQAAQKKPWLPVRFGDWDAGMASVGPDDIEELGMTMMVLMKGMDHCRRWAGETNLERFDLLPPG